MHFIILYIYNFKYDTNLCTLLYFSEHSISHRLPRSHAVWSLFLDGNLLNLIIHCSLTLLFLVAGLPLVAIVIGSLLGAIALGAGAVFIAYCFCKKKPRVGSSDYNLNVDESQSAWKYNMPLARQDRVWQHLVQENGDQGMSWGGVVPPPGMDTATPSAAAQNVVSGLVLGQCRWKTVMFLRIREIWVIFLMKSI